MHETTLTSMREIGFVEFTWVHPSEMIGDTGLCNETGNSNYPHGAFLYKVRAALWRASQLSFTRTPKRSCPLTTVRVPPLSSDVRRTARIGQSTMRSGQSKLSRMGRIPASTPSKMVRLPLALLRALPRWLHGPTHLRTRRCRLRRKAATFQPLCCRRFHSSRAGFGVDIVSQHAGEIVQGRGASGGYA